MDTFVVPSGYLSAFPCLEQFSFGFQQTEAHTEAKGVLHLLLLHLKELSCFSASTGEFLKNS